MVMMFFVMFFKKHGLNLRGDCIMMVKDVFIMLHVGRSIIHGRILTSFAGRWLVAVLPLTTWVDVGENGMAIVSAICVLKGENLCQKG